MKVRAFKDWFDKQVAENPEILNMDLAYIDVGRGTWFDGLSLCIQDKKRYDGTEYKEVEIDGI